MATSTIHLSFENGPKKGETLVRKAGSLIRIGRVVKGNNFTIKDDAISQKHLVIKFIPEISQWAVEDLDTSNGTIVNDVMIASSVPVELSDGDVVKIGEDTSILVSITAVLSVALKPQRGRAKKAEAHVAETSVATRRGRSKNPVEEVPVSTLRRGRSRKVEESVEILDHTVPEPKNLGRGSGRKGNSSMVLDAVAAGPVEESKNLRRGRSRTDDSVSVVEESGLAVEDSVDVPQNARRGRRGRPKKTVENEKVVASGSLVDRSVEEGLDGVEKAKVVGSGKEALDSLEEEMVVDIETLTLGQWFDSMERFLPLAINDVAQEVIATLREKARLVDEFLANYSEEC